MIRFLLVFLLTGMAWCQEPLLKIGSWLPEDCERFQVSPNGKRLITLGYDARPGRALELWDVPGGKLIAELHPHTYFVSAAFLPDGKQVAALVEGVDETGTTTFCGWVWDSGTGKVLARRPGLGGTLAEQSRLVAPDTIAFTEWSNQESGDENGGSRWAEGSVNTWHWPTGKVRRLGKVTSRISNAAVSPDGRYVAVLGGDTMLGIWEPHHGKLVGKTFSVGRFAFTSEASVIVVDGQVCSMPSLRAVRGLKATERWFAVAGARVYELYTDGKLCLDARTLRAAGPASLQAEEGFVLREARPMGALRSGRLVMWDFARRAVGVLGTNSTRK